MSGVPDGFYDVPEDYYDEDAYRRSLANHVRQAGRVDRRFARPRPSSSGPNGGSADLADSGEFVVDPGGQPAPPATPGVPFPKLDDRRF